MIVQFAIMCSIYVLHDSAKTFSNTNNNIVNECVLMLFGISCVICISAISSHWGQNVFQNIDPPSLTIKNSILFSFIFLILSFILLRIRPNNQYNGHNVSSTFLMGMITMKKPDLGAYAFIVIILSCLLYRYFYGLQTRPELFSICFILLYTLWHAIIYNM